MANCMMPLLLFIFKLIRRKKVADPPGFEPGPEAPEASILSWLYYESKHLVPKSEVDLSGTDLSGTKRKI